MVKVTQERIDQLMNGAEYKVFHAIFGKQCIVVAKLSNGFTIKGESACVDPANYDEGIGFEIAKKDIERQLWMLEGYLLQNTLEEVRPIQVRHLTNRAGDFTLVSDTSNHITLTKDEGNEVIFKIKVDEDSRELSMRALADRVIRGAIKMVAKESGRYADKGSELIITITNSCLTEVREITRGVFEMPIGGTVYDDRELADCIKMLTERGYELVPY